MVAFKEILFPVDLSGVGERIVPYVRMMVNTHQAKLHVIHALENFSRYNSFLQAHVDVGRLMDEMTQSAKMSLEGLVAKELPGVEGGEHLGAPGQSRGGHPKLCPRP